MQSSSRTRSILLAGALGFAAFAQTKTYQPGKDRWPVKTSVLEGTLNSKPKTMTFSKLLSLPNVTTGQLTNAAQKEHEQGTKFQDARIRTAGLPQPQEGDMVATKAFLQLITAEPDGDYHMQLSEAYDQRAPVMIVEIPRPEFVSDPALKRRVADARSLLDTKLNGGNEIEAKMCIQHPPQIKVDGQLFFDRTHLSVKKGPGGGRGKDGHKAESLWEIHPVTDVTFVSKKDPGRPAVKCP